MAVNKDIPKKRGRPATGKDPMLTFRSPPELTARIEDFAERIATPRSEAIRRLVEHGLERFGPEDAERPSTTVPPITGSKDTI
jgi:hypothetical protein